MSYLLSDYFKEDELFRDTQFLDFGYSTNNGEMLITYADTLFYMEKALKNKNVTAIIITKYLVDLLPKKCDVGIVIKDNPRNAFFELYEIFLKKSLFSQKFSYGRGKNIKISPNSFVSPKTYIGNNCEIADNVVIKDNVYIGDNCFIDAGVVVGCEGVLYQEKNGNNHFLKHGGSVKILNNVTILSNAVIVKSIFPNESTLIDEYSIIGISTTIGHEAKIGKNCRVLGNCVVAKSANIGNGTLVGSSSVIRENVKIGNNVNIKAGSIVVNSLQDNEVVSGNFAYNHNKQVKNFLRLKR